MSSTPNSFLAEPKLTAQSNKKDLRPFLLIFQEWEHKATLVSKPQKFALSCDESSLAIAVQPIICVIGDVVLITRTCLQLNYVPITMETFLTWIQAFVASRSSSQQVRIWGKQLIICGKPVINWANSTRLNYFPIFFFFVSARQGNIEGRK